VSLSSYIPVPQCCRMRFARLAGLAASDVGRLGASDLGEALSSDQLKQSRARCAARARPAVDVSAPVSLSAVSPRGWRPSRMACVMSERVSRSIL
jgi:hypothetical protein